MLPRNYVLILQNYLSERKLFVQLKDDSSSLKAVCAAVSQGSVLGPILYLLFTADIRIPQTANTMIATFANDTVVLCSDNNLEMATKTFKKISTR